MPHVIAKSAALIATMSLMAGCAETFSKNNQPNPVEASYTAQILQADRMLADSQALARTDPASLPTTGSASYNGIMTGTVYSSAQAYIDMAGDMSMDVDFANASLTGSVENVTDSTGGNYDGSLAIAGGSIDSGAAPGANQTFSSALTGSLTNEDAANLTIAGTLGGDFLGAGGEAMIGGVEADVATSGGIFEFSGGFIAAQ